MNDNLIAPLAGIAAERAALAPKIAALDVKIGAASQKLAELRRAQLDTGGKPSPKVDPLIGEHGRLSNERGVLVRRDQELDTIARTTQAQIDRLRLEARRLEADTSGLDGIPAALYGLLCEAEDACIHGGGVLAQQRAHIFRQAAEICRQGDATRETLGRLRLRIVELEGGAEEPARRAA